MSGSWSESCGQTTVTAEYRDWQMVTIDVDVHSTQLRIEERMKRRKIALFDDGRSMAARFEGEVIGANDRIDANLAAPRCRFIADGV